MRFASLGSGSSGNSLVVEASATRILIDCGFGLREVMQRILRLGIQPEQISGILVTHEHDDHAGGVFRFANKFRIPVWLTYGTFTMSQRYLPSRCDFRVNIIDSHEAFNVGDLHIQPFPVPHDAREPVQYVMSDGQRRLGILTDTGTSTPHIETMLNGCDGLVLECNHDLDMLMNGPYAQPLKKRVSSRLGHLDNQTSASLLSRLDNSRLKHLLAAHLSAQNNSPHLARSALSTALNCKPEWIGIADQEQGFDWRQL
ncbi:MAG TPA: MBL fold metallo-hydrolase [Methylophilaceae bacterium]|nr:MBL fold metallo-hydrolase [Methylophilaceae bacterium]